MMNSPVAPITSSDTLTSNVPEKNAEISRVLGEIMSDSYMLFLKTQYFHWNVEGHRFVGIHKLTEEHYLAMVEPIDTLAERIRALGFYAPGTFRDFIKLAEIQDAGEMPINDEVMVSTLEQDHMHLVTKLKDAIKVAEDDDDTTTSDLLSERRSFHEKAAWMYRSLNKH